MFGVVHGGEGRAGDGGGSVTEVMDAEAAASGGWPHTQCAVVLYEHMKCLSVCLSLPTLLTPCVTL